MSSIKIALAFILTVLAIGLKADCGPERGPLIADWCGGKEAVNYADCPGYVEGMNEFKFLISKLGTSEEKLYRYLVDGPEYSMDVLGDIDDEELAKAATVIFPILELEKQELLRDTVVTLFSRLCSKNAVEYLWRYAHAAYNSDPLSAAVAFNCLKKVPRCHPGAVYLREKSMAAWNYGIKEGFEKNLFTEDSYLEILSNLVDKDALVFFQTKKIHVDAQGNSLLMKGLIYAIRNGKPCK